MRYVRLVLYKPEGLRTSQRRRFRLTGIENRCVNRDYFVRWLYTLACRVFDPRLHHREHLASLTPLKTFPHKAANVVKTSTMDQTYANKTTCQRFNYYNRAVCECLYVYNVPLVTFILMICTRVISSLQVIPPEV